MRLLMDENIDGRIIQGLRKHNPDFDFVRVQDIGELGIGAPDPAILDWAAKEGRIVVTHDVTTMIEHAHERVREALPMPGLFVVPKKAMLIRLAIEELILIIEVSKEGEWEGRVEFIPLK